MTKPPPYGEGFKVEVGAVTAGWVACAAAASAAVISGGYAEAGIFVLLMLWWRAERLRAEAERITLLSLEDATRRQAAGRELLRLLASQGH